ncbi:DUF6119 family protein [Gimesia chilikensis]|uniref:Sporadically distributed protein, TIGR04141 family n=1 Tax=Gimesia chilikensis TaxID=2605989 RepID=A0A517PYH2_9PLAN|nr:TIGR04141 family sporadically distributed protein [Gimesia chilikensis]QDT24419.1 hypothetical protein HG66A1_62510 [Gimesia chilikensis]
MAKKKKKIQPLRMYLLKSSVTKFKDALRTGVSVNEYSLKTSPGISGKFYLRPSVRSTPDWAEFIQSGVTDKLPKIQSIANAGVLFLKIDNRIVALVFGTGRYLLKDSAYETDFGLRSTLNAVDPKTLDQIDVNWFGEMVVQKRIQVSHKSSLAAFEIDVNRERFKSLTGKAKRSSLGGRINGSEGGFGVHTRIDFKELANQCRECIKVYRSKDYKKAFPRYDDFSVVTDATKQSELDDKLLSRLQKGNINGLHMSPPDIISFDNFSGYSFSAKGDVHDEMLLEDYLSSGKDFENLKLENLKSHRVFLRRVNDAEPLDKWSAYRCLICEIKEGTTVYVLWDGKWYKIAKEFADKVRDDIEVIPDANTSIPATTTFKLEADFLKDCANNHVDLALMDRKNVWCDNAGSEMEVCDLFSESRQFIHVKRRAHGSSGLSHLFAQGRNSAEAFLKDESFRAGAKEKLKTIATKFGKKIPPKRPSPEKFEVVYVVMGKKRGKFINELPFFSQLTLHLAAKDLRIMGFKVSFQFVEAPE